MWISRGTVENVKTNATRASAIFDQHRLSSRRWPKHDRLLSGVESPRWTKRCIETRIRSKKFLFRKFLHNLNNLFVRLTLGYQWVIVWNNNTDRKVPIYSCVHEIKTYQTSQWTKVWITGGSVNMYRATTTRNVEMKVRVRWNNEHNRQICRFSSLFLAGYAICNFSHETHAIYTIHWQAYMFETTLRFFTEEQKIYRRRVNVRNIDVYMCVIEICVVDVTTRKA